MAILPEEEAAEVEVLNDRLKKMTALTDKISRSLNKLTGSAQLVKDSVEPILRQTGTLTVLADNIDAGIAEIDKTMRLLDVVKEEETTIRKGPQMVGLNDYLSSVKRLSEGLARLRSTNLRSSQKAVKDMTQLLKTGAVQLEELFRKSLIQESSPVEPLHFLTKKLPFPIFSTDKVNTLAVLNEFLSSTIATSSGLQSNATSVYTEVRGPYIANSLSSLAQGSVNTATKRSTTTVYERGDNGMTHYALALESIFDSEYENICRLFNSASWLKVYTNTTQTAMTTFSNTIRQLNNHVKVNMMTDCFLAYDVIECVTASANRLGLKTGEKVEFVEALKPIRQTASASFYELMEDLKRRGNNITILPMDNTVCELTQTVMTRLRRLTDYQTAVSGLLISLGDKNWNRPYTPTANLQSFDVGADGSHFLANYCLESIDRTLEIIEAKGKVISKKPQSVAVLMINNITYVESSIRRSELLPILSIGGGMAKIEKWRKRSVEDYLVPWKEAAGYLLDTIYTSKAGTGVKPSLSSKDKEAVKDKFKSFNTLFDELVIRHKGFVFPDKEVKQMLYKEITFISPLYARFWDKYHEIVKDKHIKYDVQTLQTTLAGCQ